jgi:hypothetical protein
MSFLINAAVGYCAGYAKDHLPSLLYGNREWSRSISPETMAWAQSLSTDDPRSLRRYAEMAYLFGRNLDFDPGSNKSRLLMLSTVADWNGALSAYHWWRNEQISQVVSDTLKTYNVQFRLVEDVSELCGALLGTRADAVMIGVHGSPDLMEFSRESLYRTHLPQNCFRRLKNLILFSCGTAGGTENIAAGISQMMSEGRVVAPTTPIWGFKVKQLTETPPIGFFGGPSTGTRTFGDRSCSSSVFVQPPFYLSKVSMQIDLPPGKFVEGMRLFLDIYFRILMVASNIAFYSQIGALALEKSPYAVRGLSFLSRNLLMKPLLYAASPCGLSRETRERILHVEVAAEEGVFRGLRVLSERISPLLRATARLVDRSVARPLMAIPFMWGKAVGGLWCMGVDTVSSFIPQAETRIGRISGKIFSCLVKTPGYILREIGSMGCRLLEE